MSEFIGTGPLLRLALRRDRILLPIWLALFAGMGAISASATVGLYPTEQSRVIAATAANATPSLVALYGPIYDATSLGALSMLKMTVMGAAMVAILMTMLTIRHTRAEEEAGRLELVEAGVVGRFAPLAAALGLTFSTSVVLGLLTALGLIAVGLPVGGSLAFGAAWAVVGMSFAAIAGIAAQFARSARAANGIGLTLLAAAYLIRAAADGSTSLTWASWLSPLGIGQQARAYAGDRWWAAALLLVISIGLAAVAFALNSRRDLGAGILPERAGPATAGAGLSSSLGLAWQLQRGAFFGWLAAFVIFGAVLGNFASTASAMLDTPQVRDLFAKLGTSGAFADSFLAAEMRIVGLIAGAYAIQATMRLHSEEVNTHAEAVLATGTSRIRWASSHIAIAIVGSAVLLVAAGASAGAAHAAQVGDWGQVGRVTAGAAVAIPAVWTLVGVVVLLFGLLPRLVSLSWAVLILSVLLGEFGELLKVNQVAMDLSPFTHVPKLPGGMFASMPLIVMALVAVVLVVVGLFGFSSRDVL
ncbi:MAG: ABC transporter permease [Candidatus Nanopelagicales bacterium]